MADFLLTQLGLLPENVKRDIAARLGDAGGGCAPIHHQDAARADAAPASTVQQQNANGADLTAAIAGRQLRLPAMQGGACVADGALSRTEVQAVAAALEHHLRKHGRRAGMGSSSSGGLWQDASLRGDVNCWATAAELRAAGQPLLAAVLQLLASLRGQLSAAGYDVGGRCSCQLVCYPGSGARYVRHTDASPSAPDRSITALLYCNPDWDCQADGGQLALYNASHCVHGTGSSTSDARTRDSRSSSSSNDGPGFLGVGEPALVVPPVGGRLLVFDSRLAHEVLPAHRLRYSITAFFYKAAAATQADTAARAAAAAAAADRLLPGPVHTSSSASGGAAAGGAAQQRRPAAASAADMQQQGDALPRIFVSIPAFRDEECQWTLRDLFVKAAHPQRVFAGVVWQVDPAADAALVRMAGGARVAPYAAQVREVRLHFSAATGPCAARSLAQQLWVGEEYVLQVDAHMRFVQGWDVLCLAELRAAQQAAGSRKVVLSTYPAGYSGAGAAAAVPEHAPATLLCAQEFDTDGMLRIRARCLKQAPAGPLPSLFWAAGFSFAPAAWLAEVPYCPHLPHLFFGEEQHMLLRMWTRGWGVWAPSRALAFHQWERTSRPHSYQACVKVDARARAASQARVLQLSAAAQGGDGAPAAAAAAAQPQRLLLAAAPPSEEDWRVGVWGLGSERSLAAFEAAAGLCFSTQRLDERALCGGQPAHLFAD